MYRRLYQAGWNLADNLLGTFVDLDWWLTPGTRILVYGAGDGQLVYQLRDLGFDAHGYDTRKLVQFRSPEDRRFFRFGLGPQSNRLPPNRFRNIVRIPFPDDFFDVVISTSSIEHTRDLSLFMSEVARVTKPDGATFHTYPKRTAFIEAQTYVPWASRLQSRAYLYFWALLGVRNEFQEGLSARETADGNFHYLHTGIHYHTEPEIYSAASGYFEHISFADDAFYYNAHPLGIWRDRLLALTRRKPLRALARTQRMGALFTRKKLLPREPGVEGARGGLGPPPSAQIDREPLELDLQGVARPLAAEALEAAGFHEVGRWEVSESGALRISGQLPARPGLYAFLVDDELTYVGAAQSNLHSRVAEYQEDLQAPQTSQVSALIREMLYEGKVVRVLVAMPEPLEWGGLPLDTAAGMEAGLVTLARPRWNVLASSSDRV